MQYDSWQAFWDMGGYAFYVWLSFGVTAVAMIWIAVDSVKSQQKLLHRVLEERQRKQRIEQARKRQTTS